MKPKAIEKTSIILLSKSTAILASVAIAVVSMVVGYLMGLSSLNSDQHNTSMDQKKAEISAAPDEKRVLEPASANATQPAPITQPAPPSTEPVKPIIEPKEPIFIPVIKTDQRPVNNGSSPAATGQEVQQPAPNPASEPVIHQSPERSLLKKTQQDMKMPLIKGDTASGGEVAAPAVQDQKKKQGQPRAALKTGQPSSSKGVYTIQLGAFPSKDGAESLRKRLASKKINAYVLDKKNSNDYYRVRYGSYSTWSAASREAAALKTKTGIDNFIAKTER